MGFITSVFDTRKLAQNLDRVTCNERHGQGTEESAFSGLSDYIAENILEMLLVDEFIRLNDIDLSRISLDDIDDLQNAVSDASDSQIMAYRLCKVFCSFSPTAINKPIVI